MKIASKNRRPGAFQELDSINLNRNFIKKVEGFEHNQI